MNMRIKQMVVAACVAAIVLLSCCLADDTSITTSDDQYVNEYLHPGSLRAIQATQSADAPQEPTQPQTMQSGQLQQPSQVHYGSVHDPIAQYINPYPNAGGLAAGYGAAQPSYVPPYYVEHGYQGYPAGYSYDNYLVPYHGTSTAEPVGDDSQPTDLFTYGGYGGLLSTLFPYAKGRSSHSQGRSIDTNAILTSPEVIVLIKLLYRMIELYWNPDIVRVLMFRALGKLAVLVVGTSAFVLLGGLFTTAVCSFTPICTITFMPVNATQTIPKDMMRSLMTPANLEAASSFVQQAIENYHTSNQAEQPRSMATSFAPATVRGRG